ncbi:methylamine utilization protein [Eionea flava]
MKQLIYSVLSTIIFLAMNAADAITLQVLDHQGLPLENAVVVLPSIAATPTTQPLVMDQRNRQFSPSVLTASAGQLVAFPNSDNVRHHVYSFSRAKPFEIKLYSGTETSPIMFDSPGIIVLGCNIHDNMIGYILVSDGQWSAVSNNDGIIHLPEFTDNTSATLWHPQMSDRGSDVHSVTLNPKKLSAEKQITITLDVSPAAPKTFDNFKRRYNRG